MAIKSSKGGKRNASSSFSSSQSKPTKVKIVPNKTNQLPPATNQVIPPTPQQIANGDVLPTGGVPFTKFEQMSDDQKAQVITDALKTGLPMFLDDSGLQRVAYFTGMSNKPQVVDEKTLNSMSGTDIYRSVNPSYNPTTDIGYTANDIAKQIMSGDFTNYSDTGGSVHGKAIYFSEQKGLYGSGGKTVVIHAKVTGSKTISENSLRNMLNKEMNSGSSLAKAISKADRNSQLGIYALAKGYDSYYSSGNGYHMIVNRRGIAISSKLS